MEIWLVRHAVAAAREQFEGPDSERPLTDKGRKRFRTFAKGLARQTDPPDLIISSPLVRARQTAEILRRALHLKKKSLVTSEALSPGVSAQQILELAGQHACARIALVGHEPDFSQALGEFIAGGEVAFGKGFVAAVDFDPSLEIGSGRLRWFVGPKLNGE